VLDFGIAKGVGLSNHDNALLGTPLYMAPEQALGREVDQRADVYAASAILYELLAGRPLFSGESTHEILTQVVRGEWLPLQKLNPDLPGALCAAVEAGLALNPEHRLQSAEALAQHLLGFVSAETSDSVAPRSFRSVSPIPLVSPATRRDATALDAFSPITETKARAPVTYPPVELMHFDRWSGERTLSHSLLERPRIPRAPSPPRLGKQSSPLPTPKPMAPMEREERRATTAGFGSTNKRSRLRTALFATLAGFAIGLALALICAVI
jgi:serine/threonine protein kinase